MKKAIGAVFVTAMLLITAFAGCQMDAGDVEDIVGTIVKSPSGLPDSIRIVLGRGYDLTGRYAHSPDVRASVLDLGKLTAAEQVMKDPNLRFASFETISGDSAESYQTELSRNVTAEAHGEFPVASFSVEVGVSFGESTAGNASTSFATSYSKIVKDAYFVENRLDPAKLIPYLSDDFKTDLENLDFTDEAAVTSFIGKYGTHVLLGGVLGARLDYHMSAQRRAGERSGNMGYYAKASAEATYAGMGGGASFSVEENSSYKNTFENGSLQVKTQVYGGNPEYGRSVQDSQDYNRWIDSIAGNEIWSDYYPRGAAALYFFVEDEVKRDELKTALISYFEDKGLELDGLVEPVEASVPRSYTLDMSNGANVRIINGDGEINSADWDRKVTNWTFELQDIRKVDQGNNEYDIMFTAVYTVKEGGGDQTEVEVKKEFHIPVGSNILSIDCATRGRTEGSYTHNGGDSLRWFSASKSIGSICKVTSVRIDGTGDNDQNNVGVKFTITIPYTYMP
jgi:hypothetical protein